VKFVKILQYLLIIAIIALAVIRLAPNINDIGKLWELKDHINYWWIMAALFSQVLQYVGDGWFSQILLKVSDIKVKFKDSMRIASLNVFAAHLLPIGEAGGMAAAYHFYRKLGVTTEKFIFLTICWTVVTNVLLILLFLIPSFFLQDITPALNTSIIFLSILIVMLFLMSIYLVRHHIFRKLEKILGKYRWAKPFFSFARNRRIYLKRIRKHPMMVVKSILASLIYYASNIATLAFSFLALGTMPSMTLIIFAYAAALLFSKITLAPAGIGAAEASLILIFLGAHIDPTIAIGATLIYRFISFWLPIPAGFISYYSLKKESGTKLDLKTVEDQIV
jgi:hypothetical protein